MLEKRNCVLSKDVSVYDEWDTDAKIYPEKRIWTAEQLEAYVEADCYDNEDEAIADAIREYEEDCINIHHYPADIAREATMAAWYWIGSYIHDNWTK